MQFNVQVEKVSTIVRKLTIKIPAAEVDSRFQTGLAEIQKTANLKGFRVGQAPISIIRQFYGEDVRHRMFHRLVDESFGLAVHQEQLKAVGSPTIDSPEHKTGEGEHDHGVQEGKDFTYIATFEVLPEIEPKGYTGIPLTRDIHEVTDAQVEEMVKNFLNSQAELVPATGGLLTADGSNSSRPVRKTDHVDMTFKGGLVTDTGINSLEGMSGTRTVEIGSGSLIPGFEEQCEGMRTGETKTFRVKFPSDYHEATFADKEAEFTVTVNEIKEKKLPELNDEFAKGMGYDDLNDLRKKAHEYLVHQKTNESDRKLRNDLLKTVIEKNQFEVPRALVESQTKALAQDMARELKSHGYDEKSLEQVIGQEIRNLEVRAENQVRSSWILEAISQKEKIEVSEEEFDSHLKGQAASMKMEYEKLKDYYAKDPGQAEDISFRLRQDKTVKFLLDKSKIKSK
ncbi:trigger factor [Bdellovibrionota bacterium FG-2]